jgi:hypothetical protein
MMQMKRKDELVAELLGGLILLSLICLALIVCS